MDHRQLQLFLAVAERLNLSQAAEAMGITQPGLSKSMHRLHRALGTRLYHRRGRGIELTEAGRAFVRHAKLVETQLADARAEVVGIADGKWGHARIGAGPSWLSRHLPVTISRIMSRHPNIRFTVDTGFPDKLIGRLRLGELDIVIGSAAGKPDRSGSSFSTADERRHSGRRTQGPSPNEEARSYVVRLRCSALGPARPAGACPPAAGARPHRGRIPGADAGDRGRFSFADPRGAKSNRLPWSHHDADSPR